MNKKIKKYRQAVAETNPIGRSNRWQSNGLARFRASITHSLNGLRAVFISEQAFRWGVYLGIIFFGALFFITHITRLTLHTNDWLFLIAAYLILLAFELINSAIEVLCDLVHPTYHRLIKASKDMASAAVFLSYLFNGLVWLVLVVWPLFNIIFRRS